MYITRHMEKPVMELNEQYPVLLLTGPRQVGKTTMLEHLIEVEGKGRKKVSLDDLTLRELAKTDPKMFFQLYQPPLLIDEVQYAPELFPYIKIMVDERHQPGDFWLTGSQLFKMMEGVQESLAGRVALLHLSPLSQSEIMKRPPEPPFSLELPLLSERQNGRQMLNTPEVFQRIHQGGMPALVTGTYSNASIFYSSYIDTYMERDVRRLSNDIDSLKFLRFLRSVAARTSSRSITRALPMMRRSTRPQPKTGFMFWRRWGSSFYWNPIPIMSSNAPYPHPSSTSTTPALSAT